MNNGIYAIYNGTEYRCNFSYKGTVVLLSEKKLEGFEEFMGTYSKEIEKDECTRIYKKTLCFRYKDDDFLIRDEKGGMVLLETGPRSYDLLKLGFKRVIHDTFQKWVPISEGEKYWANTEY